MISIFWLIEVVALAALAGGVGVVVAWRGRLHLRHQSAAVFWSSSSYRSQSVWDQIEQHDDQVITRLFLAIALPPTFGLVPLIAPWIGYSGQVAGKVALAVFAYCAVRLLSALHRRGRCLSGLRENPAPRRDLTLPAARKGFTEAEFELVNPRNFREAGAPLRPGMARPAFLPPLGRSGARR